MPDMTSKAPPATSAWKQAVAEERCHKETPMFQQVKPVTLWRSVKALSFRLWDEQRRKLVGYRRVRTIRREIALPRAGG